MRLENLMGYEGKGMQIYYIIVLPYQHFVVL